MEKLATDIYTFEKLVRNGKTQTLIGLAFSKAKRTIVDAAIEEV